LQQKEQQRQDAIAQENKKFEIIKQKTELGLIQFMSQLAL